MRFRVERNPILCGSLNGDVGHFVGLNFGIKSCLSIVQISVFTHCIVIARFISLLVTYYFDLHISEVLGYLLLAKASLSSILIFTCHTFARILPLRYLHTLV